MTTAYHWYCRPTQGWRRWIWPFITRRIRYQIALIKGPKFGDIKAPILVMEKDEIVSSCKRSLCMPGLAGLIAAARNLPAGHYVVKHPAGLVPLILDGPFDDPGYAKHRMARHVFGDVDESQADDSGQEQLL